MTLKNLNHSNVQWSCRHPCAEECPFHVRCTVVNNKVILTKPWTKNLHSPAAAKRDSLSWTKKDTHIWVMMMTTINTRCVWAGGTLERYSHEGYLIKVVVMALTGEITRELSPCRSVAANSDITILSILAAM